MADDYMSLIMDGTFHSILSDSDIYNHDEGEHKYMSALPVHLKERGPAQIVLSDYTLNSMIAASLDLDWYNYIETMNGDDLNNYFSGFEYAFGSFTECQIKAYPVKGSTKFSVFEKQGLSALQGLVNFHVQNPFTERDMDAVYMQISFTALLHVNINDEYKIIGDV